MTKSFNPLPCFLGWARRHGFNEWQEQLKIIQTPFPVASSPNSECHVTHSRMATTVCNTWLLGGTTRTMRRVQLMAAMTTNKCVNNWHNLKELEDQGSLHQTLPPPLCLVKCEADNNGDEKQKQGSGESKQACHCCCCHCCHCHCCGQAMVKKEEIISLDSGKKGEESNNDKSCSPKMQKMI